MTSKIRLNRRYRDIVKSDNPFVDGYFGILWLVNYLGNYQYTVRYLAEAGDEEMTEAIFNVNKIRNYEFGWFKADE